MKKMKKALLFALCTVGAFSLASCGGGDDSNENKTIKGEAVASQQEWDAVINATLSSTNVTADVENVMEQSTPESKTKSTQKGAMKVADGKFYSKATQTDYNDTGKGYKKTHEEEYKFYYFTENDVLYRMDWDDEDGEWDVEEEEIWTAEYISGLGILDMLLPMDFDYRNLYTVAEFDAGTGAYCYETVEEEYYSQTISAEVKIKDGKVAEIIYEKRMSVKNVIDVTMSTTCTLTYGKTTIGNLPGQSGGNNGGSESGGSAVEGEQVSSEQVWNSALAINESDYEYAQYMNGELIITYKLDGENIYYDQPDSQRYIVEEDGEYYYYEVWEDGQWGKTLLSADEYASYVKFVRSDWSEYFALSAFSFNSTSGCYEAASVDVDGLALTDVAIKIANGKMVSLSYVTQTSVFTLNFTYRDIEFTVPVVDADHIDDGSDIGGDIPGGDVVLPQGEEVDAKGWAAAIEATRNADNVLSVVSMKGYLVDGDTSEPVMTGVGTMSIADNKAYVVTILTEGGDVAFTGYSYCGNVDGTNYSWISEDNQNWYCEKMGPAYDLDGGWILDEMLDPDITFDACKYDEVTGSYIFVVDEYAYYTIGFAEGKIAFFSYTYRDEELGMDMTEVQVLYYDQATVGELPDLNGVDNNENFGGGVSNGDVGGGEASQIF